MEIAIENFDVLIGLDLAGEHFPRLIGHQRRTVLIPSPMILNGICFEVEDDVRGIFNDAGDRD